MTLQYKLGDCDFCPSKGIYIVKKLPSGKYCFVCNNIRLNRGKAIDHLKEPVKRPKSKYVYVRKPTGEKILFDAIWNTRKRISFVSDTPLGDIWQPYLFAHVISKKLYPKFRLLDRNIKLLTLKEHSIWDQGLRSELILLPDWVKMFELESELKEEYKNITDESQYRISSKYH